MDTLEAQKNTIAATVASMAELGTDTTLSTPGMAADAGAVGDLSRQISDVESALNYPASSVVDKSEWESGGFQPNGTTTTNNTRMRTKNYYDCGTYRSVESKNNIELAFYAFDKQGVYQGVVLEDGSIAQTNIGFVYRTTFAFTDYPEYCFRIMARDASLPSSVISLEKAENIIFTNVSLNDKLSSGVLPVQFTGHNQYIATGSGSIGSSVSLAPVTFNSFRYAIVNCKEGDYFTVSGIAGGSGRLWAFLDENNVLLSRSNITDPVALSVIQAPKNAKKVIFNVNTIYDYSFYKGNLKNIPNERLIELIPTVEMESLPDAFKRPTLSYKQKIGNDNVSRCKGSVFKNGNAYCVAYGENLVGTTDDFPRMTSTGTLAVKYKYFKLSTETDVILESDVEYGIIAQKGTQYISWDGTEKSFVGGCGLPSGDGKYQYFSSAVQGNKTYNGISNYKVIPCRCQVLVSDSGVTFGDIHEFSLTIGEERGEFDISRINSDYYNYYIYYTTTPPTKSPNGTWYWLLPVIKGIAFFTSQNGVDWTFVTILNTWYQPQCEVYNIAMNDTSLLFAARTRTEYGAGIDQTYLFVGVINVNGYISQQYKIKCKSSRPTLVKDAYSYLLIYNPISYDEALCMRIFSESSDIPRLYFRKWFSMSKDCTWYTSILASSLTLNYSNMYLIGTNGNVSSNRGTSFAVLSVEAGPHYYGELPAAIEPA